MNNQLKLRVFIFCFLLAACSTDNSLERYSIVHENYDESVKKDIIYINEANIENIKEDGFETISAPEGAFYEVGLGHWPAILGEKIISVDYRRKNIKEIDINSGRLLNEYAFEGGGPGEYRNIHYYFTSDSNHFIVDLNLGKIVRFDENWNHIQDLVLKDFNPSPFNKFSLSNSLLYYSSASNEDHLINQLNLKGTSNSITSFHKRIISIGKKPVHYNYVLMDSYNQKVAVTNHALPIVFIYNRDLILEQIISIQFPGLEKIETNTNNNSDLENRAGIEWVDEHILLNPPPIEIETDKRIRYNQFMIDILLTEDMIILYYANRNADLRFLTVLKKTEEAWIHQGSYRFIKEDGSLFTVFALTHDKTWLYMSSQFEEDIIRIKLDDL
jgi:hypothetical protein